MFSRSSAGEEILFIMQNCMQISYDGKVVGYDIGDGQ